MAALDIDYHSATSQEVIHVSLECIVHTHSESSSEGVLPRAVSATHLLSQPETPNILLHRKCKHHDINYFFSRFMGRI